MTVMLYATTAATLFALGLYAVLVRTGLIHRLLAANVMATAVFLFLILVSAENPEGVDAIPQAMVLTGIVIAVSLTAFALALLRYLQAADDEEDQTGSQDGRQNGPD
ncbi:NADH-quinone oxidoreductase subunit K [Gammaproteobacteria bacterium AB-CW1]|uniref:NADH-quinone oxidoreductase subunit K n=1 Tax=Natronospira elongata TaxID=3110268 RepID=A0AAP6JF90_9GAMM|nr:NADH-quinone oxidoreductase subunit K [Gammaproteobacteria bacterium AB-CW1]